MNQVAISIVQEYADENFFEPLKNWPKNEFIRRSYSRWALQEILSRLMEQEDILPWDTFFRMRSPIEVISEFIDELDSYVEISRDEKTRLIFSIARDSAEDALCLFL